MSLMSNQIRAIVGLHKQMAEDYIKSSEKQLYITVPTENLVIPSGAASMFSDLLEGDDGVRVGPFYCIWQDAEGARATENSREARLANRWITANVVAKVWLEDILIDSEVPNGETYLDRAINVVNNDLKYEVLGHDKFGMGTTDPYIIAIALKGSWTNE